MKRNSPASLNRLQQAVIVSVVVSDKYCFRISRSVLTSNLFLSYLSKIQVNEAESEELQTDGEAVEQPVDRHG